VLPAGNRLRTRADFTTTLREARGARADGLLVVHVRLPDTERAGPARGERTTRVGFVVSRAVGPAVTRNRVKRRLRHLLAGRLAGLPVGSRVVVRALPPSAQASSARLDAALHAALDRATRVTTRRPGTGAVR
jgi:ribonuclease P protein component